MGYQKYNATRHNSRSMAWLDRWPGMVEREKKGTKIPDMYGSEHRAVSNNGVRNQAKVTFPMKKLRLHSIRCTVLLAVLLLQYAHANAKSQGVNTPKPNSKERLEIINLMSKVIGKKQRQK